MNGTSDTPLPPTNTGQHVASVIGRVVFTKTPQSGAMFNLEEQDKAFATAKRWGASIQALMLHPEGPKP